MHELLTCRTLENKFLVWLKPENLDLVCLFPSFCQIDGKQRKASRAMIVSFSLLVFIPKNSCLDQNCVLPIYMSRKSGNCRHIHCSSEREYASLADHEREDCPCSKNPCETCPACIFANPKAQQVLKGLRSMKVSFYQVIDALSACGVCLAPVTVSTPFYSVSN